MRKIRLPCTTRIVISTSSRPRIKNTWVSSLFVCQARCHSLECCGIGLAHTVATSCQASTFAPLALREGTFRSMEMRSISSPAMSLKASFSSAAYRPHGNRRCNTAPGGKTRNEFRSAGSISSGLPKIVISGSQPDPFGPENRTHTQSDFTGVDRGAIAADDRLAVSEEMTDAEQDRFAYMLWHGCLGRISVPILLGLCLTIRRA